MAVLAETRPLINSWLKEFLRRHRARYTPHDWPEPGSEDWKEYVRLWFEAFRRERVEEHEADTASMRLGEEPPQWQRDHLPRVMAEIRALRAANRPADTPTDRDAAARDSRFCEHCEGSGLAYVVHPAFDGSPSATFLRSDGEYVQGPSRVLAHCTCSLGRWMRDRTDAETRRRIPDLVDVVEGRSAWRQWRLTEG